MAIATDTCPDPTACPPGWASYQPPAGKPQPGQNPAYDRLETERRRAVRMVEEATNTLAYHDLRGLGLAAALQAQRNWLAEVEKQQAALLAAR